MTAKLCDLAIYSADGCSTAQRTSLRLNASTTPSRRIPIRSSTPSDAALAADIATTDAAEFANQYPAYAADVSGEIRAALAALQTGPVYRQRYTAFMDAMVYGDRPTFDDAIATVRDLAEEAWP